MAVMRFAEFVRAYPREVATIHRPEHAPVEYDVFEGYQRAYGMLLHDLLRGAPDDPAVRFPAVHEGFQAWARIHLDALVRAVSPGAGAPDFSGAGDLVFGQLSMGLARSWSRAFLGTRVDRVALRSMQLFLAALSVNIQSARDAAADAELDDDLETSLRAVQWGMLTEIDTAIVLLELAKAQPWMTVLPAPAAFESAAGAANADFLVLDLERGEALGVQAKTRVRDAAAFGRYRSDRVVLVDGWADLGNVRLVDIPRRSDRRAVTWPGLIGAHHLAGVGDRSQDMLRAHDPAWLAEKRTRARGLTAATRDYRRRALGAVGDRVLPRFSRTAAA
jgi:hypothetical protein